MMDGKRTYTLAVVLELAEAQRLKKALGDILESSWTENFYYDCEENESRQPYHRASLKRAIGKVCDALNHLEEVAYAQIDEGIAPRPQRPR